MKQSILWGLAAILTICGTTMTLTSCSDNDDNGTVTPETPEKEYVIEMGKEIQ